MLPLGSQNSRMKRMNSTATAKETRLHIRASASQKALLARAARSRHLNVSQFVLQTCLEAAEKVVQEKEAVSVLRVSATEHDWLMKKLQEPPRDNAALRRALHDAPTWKS